MKHSLRRVILLSPSPAMRERGCSSAAMSSKHGRAGGGGSAGLSRLDQLAQDDVALEGADVVDEQHAVEVIHLVLDAGREQPLGRQLADLALVVEVAHP